VKFEAAAIAGVQHVTLERHTDSRGYFARLHCEREFAAHGLPTGFVQSNLSYNRTRGTVRGLHFQWPPSREGKLVRCVRARIFDVMVDLRPDSKTFAQHYAVELSAERGEAIYIRPGLAHGFQSLENDAEVLYLMTDFFDPSVAHGFRFNEPAFGVEWPQAVTEISDRDRDAPAFDRDAYLREYARRAAA
jgi:dTDP-4-dehydrorhamnose 3,5-epimerase